jgi:hypothetical protein
MKLTVSIFFVLVSFSVYAADPQKESGMFFQPSAEPKPREEKAPVALVQTPPLEGDVVVLSPFAVFAPKEKEFRSSEQPAPKSHPFTVETGGTMLEHEGKRFTTKIEIQYDPRARTFNLLKISW